MRSGSFEGVLRWYPAAWRRRYGAELVTLLEDTYMEGPVPWRSRLSLLRSASVERLRASGLLGSATPPSEGVRAGSVLVLWAWAVFLVAGVGFAKLAEHWNAAVPAGTGATSGAGYDVVYCAGIAGGAIVLTAAGICMPSIVRFVRAGGWRAVRGRVMLAAALTVAMLAVLTAVVIWAHQLGPRERNGGLWTYSALAVAAALLFAATVFSWTAAVAGTARRMEFLPGVLRRCAALAVALVLVAAALVAGTVTWWAAIAARAPWFFDGSAPGTPGTAAPVSLVAVETLMVVGLTLAILGARRATTSLRRASSPDL
jgi:hypothetical protein